MTKEIDRYIPMRGQVLKICDYICDKCFNIKFVFLGDLFISGIANQDIHLFLPKSVRIYIVIVLKKRKIIFPVSYLIRYYLFIFVFKPS